MALREGTECPSLLSSSTPDNSRFLAPEVHALCHCMPFAGIFVLTGIGLQHGNQMFAVLEATTPLPQNFELWFLSENVVWRVGFESLFPCNWQF